MLPFTTNKMKWGQTLKCLQTSLDLSLPRRHLRPDSAISEQHFSSEVRFTRGETVIRGISSGAFLQLSASGQKKGKNLKLIRRARGPETSAALSYTYAHGGFEKDGFV